MDKQLLFYELVTPISVARHAKWAIAGQSGYRFAADTNSVPLTIPEFLAASRVYPIVFTVDNGEAFPVAIVGLDADAGLFVSEDGTWTADYIPAFVRRYPFVFSTSEDGETFTLCIDEAFDGIDRKGKTGERLFDDEGERTPFLSTMLDFVNAYQAEHQRTKAFGKLINDLDILEPTQARVTTPDGNSRALTGFHMVNREKLKALPVEKLQELVTTDAMELIYLHLQSMSNFEKLMARLTPAAAE